MNIDAAIDAFLNYIRTERRLSPKTVEAYSTDLALFLAFANDTLHVNEVEEVSHREVREWQMSQMEAGLDPNTVKRRLVSMRMWFKYMRREGWVEKDVMARISSPKVSKRLPVFFTEKEVSNIYDSSLYGDDFEGCRDRLLLCLLYETGMRRAELLALTDSSVDFVNGTIKVHGKRDKERIIPIENELLDNIKCYLALKEKREGCSEALLVRGNGSPLTNYDVSKVVKKYMTPLSHADRISPHVFRHSFATHLLNEGADIEAIKELLGHSDLSATEVYTHVSKEHLKNTYKHTHPRELKKK